MEGKLKIKAVQTVSPMNPTHPRKYFHVSLLSENIGSSIYKTSFNLIFCYKNSSEDENGSLVAGWIKESLGMALSAEQQILAGRLRQEENAESEGEMEIVSNDSGIRLIEAQIDFTMQEFLDLKKKKKEFEDYDDDVLVFWKDIDHEINPQFSPLFYIQVTNFNCGGYSVGISCSLILIDPFSMINFLKSWTEGHLNLISNSLNLPIFYRQNHGRTNQHIINQSIGQPTKKTCNSQTTIFNLSTKILNFNQQNLAEMCIFEAEKNIIGIKPISRFVLYVKESSEKIKIMKFDYKQGEKKSFNSMNEIITCTNLDDLVGNDICFIKDNKVAYCSSWINVVDDEAVVIVFPPSKNDDFGMKIIVTLPIES